MALEKALRQTLEVGLAGSIVVASAQVVPSAEAKVSPTVASALSE